MSSLISFSIDNISGNILDMTTTIVHPDEHNINASKNFVLQAVLEAYENMKLGYVYANDRYSSYPFDEKGAKEILAQCDTARLEQLFEMARGKEIPITKKEYQKLSNKSGELHHEGKKISCYGMSNDQYYMQLEPAYDDFCALADQLIESIEIIDIQDYPHWFDRIDIWLKYQSFYDFDDEEHEKNADAPDPSYSFRVVFRDASLLQHLRPACRWESAAYDFDSYAKNYENKYRAQNIMVLDAADIADYDAQTLINWWASLAEVEKAILRANYGVQTRYNTPNLMRRLHGIMSKHVFEKEYADDILQGEPSIEQLQGMTKLKMLFAANYPLESLANFSLLRGLKYIYLEACQLKTLNGIEKLTNLAYLSMPMCGKVQDCSPVGQCKQLQYLHFDPYSEADLPMLAHLTALRELNIMAFELEINDLTMLLPLTKLQQLDVYSLRFSPAAQEVLSELEERGVNVNFDQSEPLG
jgi:hypothetical protein